MQMPGLETMVGLAMESERPVQANGRTGYGRFSVVAVFGEEQAQKLQDFADALTAELDTDGTDDKIVLSMEGKG